MNLEMVIYLAPLGSLLALLFALTLVMRVLRVSVNDPRMREIQLAIRSGADAYLTRQYLIICIFFALMFVTLLFFAHQNYLPLPVPFAFLSGGFFSGLAGFIGMKVATAANARTCQAAKMGLDQGLRTAFSSGAVMGFVVVGLGLLDLSFWFFILNHYYADIDPEFRLAKVTQTMLSFGMGASMQALFARVGGGIFTKAADVGADLVGKVEAGIPEDDARNPAVIADNVGDNVGDVAGMGADLYESYVGSIIATMVLATAAGFGLAGVLLPYCLSAIGILSSVLGSFFVHTQENASQASLLRSLRRSVLVSSILVAFISYLFVWFVLGPQYLGIYYAVLTGLFSGVLIGFSTEFFTSDCYSPAKRVAQSSMTGAATVIINGIGVGMLSTFIPVLVVVIGIWLSFNFAGGMENMLKGLYGIGIAAVGMLSTLGITLATDSYGPVADNAGGIAQMSGQDPKVRERTDALDSLGNTTAATGKGFAIGSAALTALTLVSAYQTNVMEMGYVPNLRLDNPKIIIGLFIGGVLPFLFCALCIEAVGKAAGSIVKEVRRQFKEISGLMQGRAKADYSRCVYLCTKAAQKEMILPALTAILAPLIVGLIFNVEGIIGLLMGSMVTGFVLAVFMANSGGVWDNAKKYVEAGAHGGKGSDAHRATVVGDTVGDPLKDTAGPSLNILIKLMVMVAVVFSGFIVKHALF